MLHEHEGLQEELRKSAVVGSGEMRVKEDFGTA
jgi:hypothetical protein